MDLQSCATRWRPCAAAVGLLLAGALLVSDIRKQPAPSERQLQTSESSPPAALLRIASWNIAAINNNPFEYWITHPSAGYNKLMQDVQVFLDEPGAGDVRLDTVLTEAMVEELFVLMLGDGWTGVADAVSEWRVQYANRPIISGFLKDAKLGKKRLMSMPDRMTNTINLAGGGTAMRPTVINCYSEQFTSKSEFWAQWKSWMFSELPLSLASGQSKKASELVGKISRAKYPALSREEEAMSRPLSMLCQAAFDAVLVHMLDTIAVGAHKSTWQPLRSEMCNALNSRKNRLTHQILNRSYRDSDAIFLQEVSSAMVSRLKTSPPLSQIYDIFVAPNDGKRDQISVMLLSKVRFDTGTAIDHTAAFDKLLATSGEDVPVSPGDILALSVRERGTGRNYLLASFHGDTDGLATIPVTKALHQLHATGCEGCTLPVAELIVGMDANTYQKHRHNKRQGVLEFAALYSSLGLTSSWGDVPDPTNITTFNARTYLQPQLNKAVAFKDLDLPGTGDKNPKDFILFQKGRYHVLTNTKDNTGRKLYLEKQPFPTLTFPSDHGVLSAVLQSVTP